MPVPRKRAVWVLLPPTKLPTQSRLNFCCPDFARQAGRLRLPVFFPLPLPRSMLKQSRVLREGGFWGHDWVAVNYCSSSNKGFGHRGGSSFFFFSALGKIPSLKEEAKRRGHERLHFLQVELNTVAHCASPQGHWHTLSLQCFQLVQLVLRSNKT